MSLKKQAISGVIWTFAQQFSVQIINFVVQVILARLLLPEMFGLIAMLTVFISIGQTMMDGGMTTSLIRSRNPDQLDYSTVFVTNLIVSTTLYIITFFTAPFIADFYNQIILKDILRVYALTFVIRSLVAVHVAKLTKEMKFKTQMKLQVPSTIIGALVGVSMAYSGYGVWSLVWLNLTQTIIFTIQNWIFIKWRPSFILNKRRFKYHFNFGYKMTLSGLLDTVYNNAYNIVIGKSFSPTMVGYYNQAESMRLFPVIQLSTVMGKVTFPLFSNLKTDIQLRNAYKKSMQLISFVVAPMMILLIIVAKPLFLLLFGERWLPSVPYFQILAIASIFRPISTYNLNILKVKGRSELFLRLEVGKKIIGVIAIIIALPFGILGLVYSLSLTSIFFAFFNAYYSGRLINYNLKQQIRDTGVIYLLSAVASIPTFLLYSLVVSVFSNFSSILLLSLLYAIVYLGLMLVFNKDILKMIKGLIKRDA